MFVETLGKAHQWTVYSSNLWLNNGNEELINLQGHLVRIKDQLETSSDIESIDPPAFPDTDTIEDRKASSSIDF